MIRAEFVYDCTPHFVHSHTFNASRYTGKERDQESGLDYFGARYYANTLNTSISSTMYHLDFGRWMSPDWSDKPEEVPYSILTDPQSLNLYQFVRNNPVGNVDADGHECPPACGDPTLPTAVVNDDSLLHFVIGAAKEAWNSFAATVNRGTDNIVAGPGNRIGSDIVPTVNYSNEVEEKGAKAASVALVVGGAALGAKGAGAETSEVPRSIPAGPSARPTVAQQSAINEMGEAHGCHTCTATTSGTKSGNWVGDHQPPTALKQPGQSQVYKPQCLRCSRQQGGQVRAAQRAAQAAAAVTRKKDASQ